MELNEDALPLHEDATLQAAPAAVPRGQLLRRHGARAARTPPSPDDGYTYPVNQTAYSVQLDQVLTTLQADVRTDLQIFLDQLGNALIKYGGAEGFRELYRTSAPACKYTSQVNEAVLGTEPGDLSGLIRDLDRVVRGLGRNEQTLAGPGHQPPHRRRLVRRRGRRARAGDRGAARHARGGRARRSPT